ncbi:MAG: hypothetical protein V4813_15795 [Gemmatimonadota bacterium]
MYQTCLFCQKSLGANESIEALPIGRRVAFDGAKGRLWVICQHCARWNLAPFDARWEAMEQCERAYRDTRVRLSTDNVGLARLRDGTDLVRIGAPLRPEFAAWRYGDQFGRRRRRNAIMVTGATVGAGLAVTGIVSGGLAVAAFFPLIQVVSAVVIAGTQHKILRHRIVLDDGRRIAPTGSLRILDLDVEEGWGLEAGVLEPFDTSKRADRRWNFSQEQYAAAVVTVRGAHAMPLLRRFLPHVNGSGATAARVREGVELLETAGGPEGFARWAASQRRIWGAQQTQGDTGSLHHIPVAARLALEMSVNEDAERRALEGELTQLEAAWREAEELAGIADRLATPVAIERRLEELRRGQD